MNRELLFEMFSDISDEYIAEADEKNNKLFDFKHFALVACVLGFVFIFILGQRLICNTSDDDMRVIAAEIGKENLQIGATMPEIIYVTDAEVIMYDYIGIWVYSFEQEELVGFCDFREVDMTQTQGYPHVIVEATIDGNYVRFYMSDGSKCYLYDVVNNKCKQIEKYDSDVNSISIMTLENEKSLSNCSNTYKFGENSYIAYYFSESSASEGLRYGDLVIVVEKEGSRSEYRPFM